MSGRQIVPCTLYDCYKCVYSMLYVPIICHDAYGTVLSGFTLIPESNETHSQLQKHVQMLTNSHVFCLPFNKIKHWADKTVGWYKHKWRTFLLYVRITAVCYNHLGHDFECRINNECLVYNFLNHLILHDRIIGQGLIVTVNNV